MKVTEKKLNDTGYQILHETQTLTNVCARKRSRYVSLNINRRQINSYVTGMGQCATRHKRGYATLG